MDLEPDLLSTSRINWKKQMKRLVEKVRQILEREWFLLVVMAVILIVTILFDLI